jgi:serine/threonine-protein kinase
MAATATLALLAIVLLSLLLWSRWHSVPRDDRPLMHLNVDLGPDAVAGVRTTVAISRDGTRIVHPVRGANGTQQLAVRMLDQSKSLILNGTEGGQDAFFAPDGSWIAFSAEGKLKKVPVHGGAVVTVCEAPLMRGGDWGEDGSLVLAAPAVSSGLKLLPGGRADPEFVTKLSAGEITHRWPQLLPGGAILYTAHTGGIEFDNAVIKISDPKTGQQKTIVKNGYYGRFVPSGHLLYMHKNVLFAARFSAAERELQGTPVPMVVDVAGTPLAGSGQYDVASDGTLVYLSGHHQKVAWTIEALEASGKTQPAVAVPGDYIAIALSPDGRHVAYVDSTSNLWTYDITRQSATHLSTDATSPVWAPDGKHIAFGKRTESVSSISWIRSDGAQEAQPIYTSPVSVDPKSFSPDAKSLAIEIFNSGTNTDIAILPLDLSDPAMPKAGKPEMFVHTPSFDGDPAFSPNGRWIAYRSGLFERPEIFVRPYAPGSRQVEGRWQITTRGRGPEWSRDGRHLFYMSGGQIMSVTVTEQGDTIVPEKPVPWSTFRLRSSIAIRSFSVMPDGKRLLVIPAEPAPVENRENSNLHVTFLLNFADELRRKVPVR